MVPMLLTVPILRETGNQWGIDGTSAENPQQLSDDRIMFKQGLSRNRNVFLIRLDENGHMKYNKVIDDTEARLPLMVSAPYIDRQKDELMFYAKRGTKKQLVQVGVK